MKQDIEIEIRGALSKETYRKTKKFLEKHGSFKEEKHRIFIDYSTFLPGEGIRERRKDIRVRMTNGVPEIVVKLGSWGGSENRKELSFKGNKGDFETLVEIFGHLGLSKGICAKRNTMVYDYKGIEFALVEVPGHSYYFEAEKMAHSAENVAEIEKKIKKVCAELGLSIWNQEEFFSYIETLNKEANAIFDFNDYSPSLFKEMLEI